jgi:hypothetical protein
MKIAWMMLAAMAIAGMAWDFVHPYDHIDLPNWQFLWWAGSSLALRTFPMAMAALAAYWTWFGRRGRRPWCRASVALLFLAALAYLTMVHRRLDVVAAYYGLWLWLVIVLMVATLFIDVARHLHERWTNHS